jgi:vancomycin resistance protein VanJ
LDTSPTLHRTTATLQEPSRSLDLQRFVRFLALLYPVGVLALSAINWIAPQRTGALALTQIFAPYLFAPLLALLPFAIGRAGRGMRTALLLCTLVFGARFGSTLVSLPSPATAAEPRLTATTWNLYVSNGQFDTITGTLAEIRSDVVAVQELTHAQADALAADRVLRERFPTQLLQPGGTDGMGILSRFPLIEHGDIPHPRYPDSFRTQWARLDTGDGASLIVINAHPRPARLGGDGLRGLLGYDPTFRDSEIANVRQFVDGLLDRGERVLLLGDFNTAEGEPAYAELTQGLQDAHRLTGQGWGFSWRPNQLMQRWGGIVRIDYLLSSPQLVPRTTSTDCTPRGGDHCIVRAEFAANNGRGSLTLRLYLSHPDATLQARNRCTNVRRQCRPSRSEGAAPAYSPRGRDAVCVAVTQPPTPRALPCASALRCSTDWKHINHLRTSSRRRMHPWF